MLAPFNLGFLLDCNETDHSTLAILAHQVQGVAHQLLHVVLGCIDIDIDIDIEGLLYNTIDGLLRVLQSPHHHGVTLYCWVQGRGSAFHDRLP